MVMDVISVVGAPVKYFRGVMQSAPRWGSAAVPVAVAAVLGGVTSSFTIVGIVPDGPMALALMAFVLDALSVVVVFGVYAGILVAIDVLFVFSGRAGRLIECMALAYWTQVPIGIISVAFAAHYDRGAIVDVGGSGGIVEGLMAVAEVLNESSADWSLVMYSTIALYFGLWLMALHSCALHVVSGMSVRSAALVGGVMAAVFVVTPWAVGRFL